MSFLYVVSTPIGNLEDLTFRALRVLGEVGFIAAEDTRVTRRLLDHYKISTPMTSYHEHNKLSKLPLILSALKEKDVALVSDAGEPGISDPGSELVSAAAAAGVQVVPIPGASAITSAIAVSGMDIDMFIFLGFLPRKQTERRSLLESLATDRRVLLAFEAPHRLRRALHDIRDILGDRHIAVCRELTKLHEEVFRATVSEAMSHFDRPRGEVTLVIEGSRESPKGSQDEMETAMTLLEQLREEGAHARDVVAQVVQESGLPRREVYRLWLEIKERGHKG